MDIIISFYFVQVHKQVMFIIQTVLSASLFIAYYKVIRYCQREKLKISAIT